MKHAKAINNQVLTTDCSCSKISKFGKKKQIKFKIHAIALQQSTLWSHYEKCKEIFLAMKVMNIIY